MWRLQVGGMTTYMPRVQDYSTTSLEFSDVDSLVSDSLGGRSDDEEMTAGWAVASRHEGAAGWGHSRHEGAVGEELLDRQPVVVGFVEFTPSADVAVNDRSMDERLRQTRSAAC